MEPATIIIGFSPRVGNACEPMTATQAGHSRDCEPMTATQAGRSRDCEPNRQLQNPFRPPCLGRREGQGCFHDDDCGDRMECTGLLGNQTCRCITPYLLNADGSCGTFIWANRALGYTGIGLYVHWVIRVLGYIGIGLYGH